MSVEPRRGPLPKKTAAQARGKTRHSRPADSNRAARGRAAHRASRQGASRADKPANYGAPDEFPKLNEDVSLRLWALPASGGQFQLNRVEAVSWTDANAITTGAITMREAGVTDGAPDIEYRLDQGDRIMCEATDDGRSYRQVWTMRVYKPSMTMSNGQRTFQLANDLDLLRQSEDNFLYTTDRAHPQGWTGRQIVEDVCARYKVALGGCYTSPKRIGRKIRVRRGSPLEVLRWVLLHEHRKYGRRLVIRWDREKLYILPLTRSPHLLELGPTLVEAAFESELRPEFGSAISIRGLNEYVLGQDSQGFPVKKRQKMHVALESQVSKRLFGYVHRIVYSPDAHTDAELRDEGMNYLAAVMKPHRTLTLTHQGIPWLRRGDAIQLAIGDQGLRKQIVYVNAVEHRATPDVYQMDVGVIFDDPYRDHQGESIMFRLKPTHDAAVGNRARLNALWYIPKNQKPDAAVNSTAPYSPPDPTFGGSLTLNPAAPDPGGVFGGGG